MIRNLLASAGASAGASSKCRTVDKLDIFDDNSGKALYRLDGNANDTGGNYHGTETDITYGGGTYGRGLGFSATTSNVITTYPILLYANSWTASFWMKWDGLSSNYATPFASGDFNVHCSQGDSAIFITLMNGSTTSVLIHKLSATQDAANYNKLKDNTWHLVTVSHIGGSANMTYYIDGTVGTPNIHTNGVWSRLSDTRFGYSATLFTASMTMSIDQLRIFNRAITATEVATLYAECAPTSTVDDINPFLDGSCKALYQFNGDATDKTGVYNGTVVGTPSYQVGKFGNSLKTNTTDCYVNLNRTIFGNDFRTAGSFSIWVRFSAFKVSGEILTDGSAATGGYYNWLHTDSSNRFKFGTGSATSPTYITDTEVLSLNTFYHVVVTRDTSGLTKLYVNGRFGASGTPTNGTLTAYNAALGTWLYYLPGKQAVEYDNLRFFNKALTPMEVASLYNETTPMEEPMHSLVDPFRDGSGKALYRLEGNALNETGNYNGTTTYATYGVGVSGTSCRSGVFNGSSSRIVTPAYPTNLITANYSIAAFVKMDYLDPNILHIMIDFAGGLCKFHVGNVPNNRVLGCYSQYAGVFVRGNTPILNLTWTHVAVTISGTTVKFYVNGVLDATRTLLDIVEPTGVANIGSNSGSTGDWFRGNIDQLRIFSKTLTQEEIAQLYTNQA